MAEERFTVSDEVAVRIAYDDMRRTITDIFGAFGMTDEGADQAADTLMYADVRGIDSHGVSNMFPIYVHMFRNDLIDPIAEPVVVRDAPAVATVDDGGGLGLATGPAAMDLAIEKARECGIGAVSVLNGRHYGAASYHAHRALPHDMIGLSMTMGGLQVLPTFGAQPMVGLNPIAVAAPTNDEAPFVFDASMSSVAGNKIRIARRLGATVAPGWISDGDGRPIMDESEVPEEFHMLPTGGTRLGGSHKGYGLAVVVDVLCGILSGNPPGFLRPFPDVSHHFMAYRLDAFCDADEFRGHMDVFMKGLRETPPAPGEERVFYAGLPEHEVEADRRERGIPYHPDVVDWFRSLCDEIGVAHQLG